MNICSTNDRTQNTVKNIWSVQTTWVIVWMKISLGSSPVGSDTSNSSPKSQNTRTQMPYASDDMNWEGQNIKQVGYHKDPSNSWLLRGSWYAVHGLASAVWCITTLGTVDVLWWGVVVSGRTHSLSFVGSIWLQSESHTGGESRAIRQVTCWMQRTPHNNAVQWNGYYREPLDQSVTSVVYILHTATLTHSVPVHTAIKHGGSDGKTIKTQ